MIPTGASEHTVTWIVGYLNVAFSIWMLVDAYRKRAPFYWYLVILLVPFGGFLYFFIARSKAITPQRGLADDTLAPPVSLEELAQRAQEIPSVFNRIAYADALVEKERYAEALPLYTELLARYPEDKEVLHGCGRAALGANDPQQAIQLLETLLDLDPGYRDYRPALDYAEALFQGKHGTEAVEFMQGLVQHSPRISHRVALAHYLEQLGRTAEALEALDVALKEHATAPSYLRKRDHVWAQRARHMLGVLQTRPS